MAYSQIPNKVLISFEPVVLGLHCQHFFRRLAFLISHWNVLLLSVYSILWLWYHIAPNSSVVSPQIQFSKPTNSMVRFLTTTAPLLVSFLYVIYFFHHSMKYLVSWSISLSLLRKPDSRSVHCSVLHLSCRYADNLGQKQIYIPQSTPSGCLLPL